MSWKMMMVLAALAIPAAGCKTVSQDSPPANPAAVQDKAAPSTVPEKVEPARTDPSKAEEGKTDPEAKPEEGKVSEGSEATPEAKTGGSEAEPKAE